MVVLDKRNVQHKIRLQGIDAPERGQPYGKTSGKHLSGLVAGKRVVIDYRKQDRYGRIVGKVLLDRQDMNLEQVVSGMAWHYKQYQREQSPDDRQRYAEAEYRARVSKMGLWVEPDPVPPWEWRKKKRR